MIHSRIRAIPLILEIGGFTILYAALVSPRNSPLVIRLSLFTSQSLLGRPVSSHIQLSSSLQHKTGPKSFRGHADTVSSLDKPNQSRAISRVRASLRVVVTSRALYSCARDMTCDWLLWLAKFSSALFGRRTSRM